MKNRLRFIIAILFLASASLPAPASFSALYVFGDSVCTTTDNATTGPLYYGNRYSNGRIWIEVLAQRQGLPYDAAKNNSYFGDYSDNAMANVNSFIAPADATNDLFIVWVCDADFVGDVGSIYPSVDLATWNTAINQSLNNHFNIITNLYAKGARTLIMPNAVDLTKVPEYNGGLTPGGVLASDWNFVRGRIIYFNTNLFATVNQAKAICPGLTVYIPDFFSLFNDVLTNAAHYGLTNTLVDGQSVDALDAFNYGFPIAATNGYGTNYIFWDYQDPTAKLHAVMADIIQQIISPVQVGKVTPFAGSNRLDMVNYPAGLNGFVDGLTNLALTNWSVKASITSSNTTQSVFVPASGPQQFYRLRFPYAWSWP